MIAGCVGGVQIHRPQGRQGLPVRSRWIQARALGLTCPPTWAPRWGQGRTEEVPRGTSVIEDIKNEDEHTPLDLGSGYEESGGDKLECILHEVHVPLGCELHPVNSAAGGTLGHGDERKEPVPRKEPARVKVIDNVENQGVARKTHFGREVGSNGEQRTQP
jgi:hypothetical protein